MSEASNPLRLRKKHGTGRRRDVSAEDGARLVRVQSLRNAAMAGLIAIIKLLPQVLHLDLEKEAKMVEAADESAGSS